MHPTATFALRALAATALAAFAASGAAAGEEVYYTIKLTNASIASMEGPAGASEPLKVRSFKWGAAKGGEIVGIEPIYRSSGDSKAAARRGTTTVDSNETITIHGGRTEGKDSGGRAKPGGLDVDWDVADYRAGDAGSQASTRPPTMTGKRGKAAAGGQFGRGIDIAAIDGQTVDPAGGDPDRPIVAGNVPNPSTPRAKGSVWIRVASPWAGCRVGARYPSLELAGGGRTYVLRDVSVASCGRSGDADDRPTEEVAFYYNKIAFNYAPTRD